MTNAIVPAGFYQGLDYSALNTVYAVGDLVRVPRWGTGTVIAVLGARVCVRLCGTLPVCVWRLVTDIDRAARIDNAAVIIGGTGRVERPRLVQKVKAGKPFHFDANFLDSCRTSIRAAQHIA